MDNLDEIGATPSGIAFVPEACRTAKPGSSIIITDGYVQAVACLHAGQLAIGLSHIWSASEKLADTGGFVLHRDLAQALDWRGRKVYIVFEAEPGPDIRQAMIRLFLLLSAAGAEVYHLISWDAAEGQTIDAYLAGLKEGDTPAGTLKMLIADAALFIDAIRATPLDLELTKRELELVELSGLLREQLCKQLSKRLEVPKEALATIDEEPIVYSFETDPEPWDTPVDGPELLNEIYGLIKAHIIIADAPALATALWIILTYVSDVVETLAILAIVSPTKRCGKTRLLGVLKRLCRRALPASNISPAAVYRSVQEYSPTILVDEVDTFLRDNDELRGIINSGHTRDTAFVVRWSPQTRRLVSYSTWAPKAIALIGKPPETIVDRSVTISLRRKTKAERVKRIRETPLDKWQEIQRKLMRWASDNGQAVRNANPVISNRVDDRAVDNWTPLLAIAKCISDNCLTWAHETAIKLSCETGEDTILAWLLTALRAMFDGKEFLPTEEIVAALTADTEAPWQDWAHGMTAEKLSKYLRPFGVRSEQPQTDNCRARGYYHHQLQPIFDRYL